MFLRKIIRNLENFGLLYTMKNGLLYLSTPIYEEKIFRVYRIELETFSPKTFKNSRFSFKLIENDDKEIIKQVERLEEWLSGRLELKLKKGGFCLAALENENIIAFNLIGFNEIYIPLIRLKKVLKKDEAWSEQITVHKKYREKGLGTELRYRVMSELKKKGINRLFGGTLRHNQPMLNLSRKVGFREIVDIYYSRLFFVNKWDYRRLRNEHF